MEEFIIIDDDQINNYICESMIKTAFPDIHLKCFTDSVEALAILSNTEVSPDTSILLDLNIPIMNGWEFLDEFKKKNINRNLFILSSSIDTLDIETAENDPFIKGYISKPLEEDKVKMIIEQVHAR